MIKACLVLWHLIQSWFSTCVTIFYTGESWETGMLIQLPKEFSACRWKIWGSYPPFTLPDGFGVLRGIAQWFSTGLAYTRPGLNCHHCKKTKQVSDYFFISMVLLMLLEGQRKQKHHGNINGQRERSLKHLLNPSVLRLLSTHDRCLVVLQLHYIFYACSNKILFKNIYSCTDYCCIHGLYKALQLFFMPHSL